MVVSGRPKVYAKRMNISLNMEEEALNLLDTLRREMPRGQYIAKALLSSEEYVQKNIELEAIIDNYLKMIEKDHTIAVGLKQRIEDLEAQVNARDEKIAKLSLQISKGIESNALQDPMGKGSLGPAKTEKVAAATSSEEIEAFRKQFMDLNYPMLYSFVKNTISQEKLVALQRQLLFPTLTKLKGYLMEEFHRRVREGLMPITAEPIKPVAPLLTPDQMAYREELGMKVQELTAEFKKVEAEVKKAFEASDQEAYNRLKPIESRLNTQLKEAMEAMLTAKESGFVRITSPVTPSPLLSTGEETPPVKKEDSDPGSFDGMSASDILAAMSQGSPRQKEEDAGVKPGC